MKKPHLKPYQFKPGQSGNPDGKPKQDPAIKKFKEMTYREFVEALQKYGAMPLDEIYKEIGRPDQPALQVMFGNMVATAAENSKDSLVARAMLIDRLWGKVKESYDLNLNNSLSDEELVLMGKAAIASLEEAK